MSFRGEGERPKTSRLSLFSPFAAKDRKDAKYRYFVRLLPKNEKTQNIVISSVCYQKMKRPKLSLFHPFAVKERKDANYRYFATKAKWQNSDNLCLFVLLWRRRKDEITIVFVLSLSYRNNEKIIFAATKRNGTALPPYSTVLCRKTIFWLSRVQGVIRDSNCPVFCGTLRGLIRDASFNSFVNTDTDNRPSNALFRNWINCTKVHE